MTKRCNLIEVMFNISLLNYYYLLSYINLNYLPHLMKNHLLVVSAY